MKLLRHAVASFVIFAVVIGVFLGFYNAAQEEYGFTDGAVQTIEVNGTVRTGNIAELLDSMPLVEGVNSLKSSVLLFQNPSNSADLIGATILGATGIVKTITGIFTTPLDVLYVIGEYYGKHYTGLFYQLVALVVVYVVFITLSAYLRSDI